MKHISVRIALVFTAICLGLVITASILLFTTYRAAIVDDKHDDLRTVYAETARLLREQREGLLDEKGVATGVDFISRVGLCKIYVLRYDPARIDVDLPDDLGIQTLDLAEDLVRIAEGKTVFREMVYRYGNESPFVFYGGPAPAETGAAAVLIYTSAGQMYTDVTDAAYLLSLAAICLIIVTAVVIFFSADRLVRPLRQMTERAHLLAQGEAIDDIRATSRDEIGELTRAFNYMKTKVLENENTRQEFLASMSHDIRTPLTHIRTSALGLKEGWIPADMRERAMDIIADESERLIGMTNNLLEAARLQSGSAELRLSVVDLYGILREAAQASPHPDQVQIDCDPGLRANIDESLFRRILSNLLDNAFRYGRPPVVIQADKADGVCRIMVRDHGDGLPESELDRIFERFYRYEKHAEKQGGSGIGLFSARRAMQLHGGAITVRNADGGGLAFTLTWPDTLSGIQQD